MDRLLAPVLLDLRDGSDSEDRDRLAVPDERTLVEDDVEPEPRLRSLFFSVDLDNFEGGMNPLPKRLSFVIFATLSDMIVVLVLI